jgi:hypothetical protein
MYTSSNQHRTIILNIQSKPPDDEAKEVKHVVMIYLRRRVDGLTVNLCEVNAVEDILLHDYAVLL